MRKLADYARSKDNYLIYYLGPNEEYLLQLLLVRPALERHFPGLQLFISCKDHYFPRISGNDRTLPYSQINGQRHCFAHLRELSFDGYRHPVSAILEEAELSDYAAPIPPLLDRSVKCVIISKSLHPVKPLEQGQIHRLLRSARDEGYEVELDKDIDGSGLVVGVESYSLYLAASQGIETRLVPTGFGTRLYEKLFPSQKIMKL